MSIDYSARAVWGVSLKPSDLQRLGRERGCSHPEAAGANYCSVCGSPMWVDSMGEVMLMFQDDRIQEFRSNTSDFAREDQDLIVVGRELNESIHGRLDLLSDGEMAALEAELLLVLSTAGITPRTEFGLHLVRHVSY